MNKHEDIGHCLLEHDVVMFGRNLPMFRRNLIPSSSGTSWLKFTKFQRNVPPRPSGQECKDEAVDTFETLAEFYHTTLLHLPEDCKISYTPL
jgi:hypothetical protein